jgi:hypothetical protein
MIVKDFLEEITSLCEGKMDRKIQFYLYNRATDSAQKLENIDIQTEPVCLADNNNNWGIEVWLEAE